jgi:hypothetical protein
MLIEKKDISWLKERVPDIDYILDTFHPLFDKFEGYIAGGFVRRCIRAGSVHAAQTSPPPGLRHNFDIDFFFPSRQNVNKTVKHIYEHLQWNKELTLSRHSSWAEWDDKDKKYPTEPTSPLKFAYEWNIEKWLGPSNIYYRRIHKLQVIAKSFGAPEEVMKSFDLANCKIAFNKDHVWVREGWEKLECEKKIHIDSARGNLLLWRAAKYLSPEVHGDDYYNWTLTDESKNNLLAWTLQRISTNNWGTLKNWKTYARKLVVHDGGFRVDQLPFFFQKLGNKVNNVYKDGSLKSSPEEFASHHMKKKMKKDLPKKKLFIACE